MVVFVVKAKVIHEKMSLISLMQGPATQNVQRAMLDQQNKQETICLEPHKKKEPYTVSGLYEGSTGCKCILAILAYLSKWQRLQIHNEHSSLNVYFPLQHILERKTRHVATLLCDSRCFKLPLMQIFVDRNVEMQYLFCTFLEHWKMLRMFVLHQKPY